MHTVQLLLIEADTHQEAVEAVAGHLEDRNGSDFWSDWWDTSGGRWQGAFGDNMPNVICYKDDPEFFEEQVKKFLEGRSEHLKEMLEHNEISSINLETLIDTHDPYMEDFGKNIKLWSAKSALRVLLGEWTCDTGVFDLSHNSAFLADFVVRAKETPEKQFGVLVDFHF